MFIWLINNTFKKIVVLPVHLSPNINCLCPLPIGKHESIKVDPVIKESLTLLLKAILVPLLVSYYIELLIFHLNTLLLLINIRIYTLRTHISS